MSKPDPDPKQPSGSSSEKDPVVAADDHITEEEEEELSEDLKNVVLLDEEEATEELNDGDQKEEEEEGRERVEKRMMTVYPVRPDAEDCSFYIRTGSCKYGSSCKFNHPVRRKPQIGREKVREREEDVENPPRLMECKYYFRTGGCKYGETCRFSHTKQQHTSSLPPSRPQLNFLGLPIRPGEKECPFYMRNGSCKFGADCKFNHPDPTTAVGGVDSPLFRGSNNNGSPNDAPQGSSTSWSSSRHMNGSGTGTAPFIPVMYSQNRGASSPQTPEWSAYQAPSPYPHTERGVFPPSTYSANKNSLAETSSFSQLSAEEFPERPDQPECSYYVKTGDCKFKFKCKYHHPKNRLPKQSPSSFNDKGLPLRPEQSMCTHYSRYGICKFGPACRFDHSIPPTFSSSSSQTVETPQLGGNGNENDSWN